MIRLVQAFCIVVVRGLPDQGCWLNVAGAKAEVVLWIFRGPVGGAGVLQIPGLVVGGGGIILPEGDLMLWCSKAAAFGDEVWLGLPETCVPLADEAAPVFDDEADGSLACFEGGALIAICRGSENINLVKVAFRQLNGLAFGY